MCFEIWFRRRRAQDTYTLQAERQDIKEAWTADLERILWEQALKSRGETQREGRERQIPSKTNTRCFNVGYNFTKCNLMQK